MKHKFIFSLRYKQIFILIAGTLLSLGMYFLVQNIGNFLVEKNYLNQKATTDRLIYYQGSLKDYITRNHISIKDIGKISKWVKNQQYVYLLIYDGDEILYESGYWDDKFNSYELTETANGINTTTGATPSLGQTENYITFSDGTYLATIMDASSEKWFNIITYVSLAVFFFFLFLIILLYNHHIIARIMQLSKEVSLIEKGNIEQPIYHKGNDEISLLAINADNMRHSIIARHKSEKDAWEANSELITSMSHDIRTPLTSLIGYLEILASGNYSSKEQFDKYIKSCKTKSVQLKDLSDKLFQYFLVFGKEKISMQMGTFDVAILFQQLISEHVFDLNNAGFQVKTEFPEESCTITADIQYLKRLFDNLFSNIRKYAASDEEVAITSQIKGNELTINIANTVREDHVFLESTNIGLKTCQKIVEQMNGFLVIKKSPSNFEVRLTFPVKRINKSAR